MEYIAFALVMLVSSYLITSLMMPKAESMNNKAPDTLDQFEFPQFEEGTPQQVVFGDVWLPDWQVLWYGDLQTEALKSSSGGGGKK